MYLARPPRTCFVEVCQAKRRVDVDTGRPMLVGFRPVRDLRWLDLTGRWPTRAGASMVLNSWPRPRAHCLARAMYETFAGINGLLYVSSMAGNTDCLASFKRAADAMPLHPEVHRSLSEPFLRDFLRQAAIALGYGI